LVGRSEELGRVLAALERAAAGSGGALLLAGEAGIGKSRLAAETLTLARRRGFDTLQAAAHPLQDDLAYAPVLELLGPFLAGLEPARRIALVAGLPDLGRLFAGLHLPPPEPLGDAALERTRLFEAVSRLVERVAAELPVALLVDDLHWADGASLELLHYLARGLGTRRVLLLGAYRLDEARTHPRLRALVRSLQRLGLAEELPIGGLGPEAVAALARGLLGGDPPAELLGVLRERAAGTPLFVSALIRGLRDTGELFRSGGVWVLGGGPPTAVPPVVRDLVLARLERLDPGDRALLELVVVAGDAAFPAVLGRVGGPGAQELDERLRRLHESGLVVEEPAGSKLVHRAAHPLIAEVAYGELPETRRRRLHAGVAAALEALASGDPQRLAHHYRGAASEADPDRALDVLVAAGRRAEELHADAEAADLFASALALARVDRPAMVGGCWSASATPGRGRASSTRPWRPGPRPPPHARDPATGRPPPACGVSWHWPSGTGAGSTRPRRSWPPPSGQSRAPMPTRSWPTSTTSGSGCWCGRAMSPGWRRERSPCLPWRIAGGRGRRWRRRTWRGPTWRSCAAAWWPPASTACRRSPWPRGRG
jgi:predicted ATPase